MCNLWKLIIPITFRSIAMPARFVYFLLCLAVVALLGKEIVTYASSVRHAVAFSGPDWEAARLCQPFDSKLKCDFTDYSKASLYKYLYCNLLLLCCNFPGYS